MSAKTPNIQQQLLVTYLKDVKASGTGGGTNSAGVYQTRTLNTQEGDTSFCSLASNQFTLQPGIYWITAYAPVGNVDVTKAKIRNITDASDVAIGNNCFTGSGNSSGVTDQSVVETVINLTSVKTFELQQRSQTSRATSGYGFPASFGDNEVYSIVKIIKLN